MKRSRQKRKCKNCQEYFLPDYRNINRQKYCSKPECRKASKADSQKRWLGKPENRDYFRSGSHAERVRVWRTNHPDYRRSRKSPENALQDACCENDKSNQLVNHQLAKDVLQDSCQAQPAVIIGLISQLTGHVLQDNIVMTLRRLQQLGNDILNRSPELLRGDHVSKATCFPGARSANASTI
jgi:hypothetical protein